MRTEFIRRGAAIAACMGLITASSTEAYACGCFSPPVPPPAALTADSFAVNQQSESILFEVEPGYVTAHVLIRYAGDPEKFAWILPVPAVPELSLSSNEAFGIIEAQTQPQVLVRGESRCPTPSYLCKYHPTPTCQARPSEQDDFLYAAGAGGSASFAGDPDINIESPVTIYQREQVGSYDTVTLGAGDATLAVEWLQGEGFIVNSTMGPYLQPYVDAGMLLIASKLIPGAEADEIRPLRMRFEADSPMIPLQLTAIAAEPHLTVTAYIFSDQAFKPIGQPLIEIDGSELGRSSLGRLGYPMLLARSVDDAGGDAFVREYVGPVPTGLGRGSSSCCGALIAQGQAGAPGELSEFDTCGVRDDGQCQCPLTEFDRSDCEESAPELLEGIALVDELSEKYSVLTRLTTRVSPEEMSFDPMFEPDPEQPGAFRLSLENAQLSLASCESDVIDEESYTTIKRNTDCSAVYCGEGECASSVAGAGCICDDGYVARVFADLDGASSVTCVPEEGPVDLSAGGLELPDSCDEESCGPKGTCKDVGGFPTCDCDDGFVATVASEGGALCQAVVASTGGPGAFQYTRAIEEIDVCAPAPPTCGAYGWLVSIDEPVIEGVECKSSIPDPESLEIPRARTCADYGLLEPGMNDLLPDQEGSGGSSSADSGDRSSGKSSEESGSDGCSCSSPGHAREKQPWAPKTLLLLLAGLGLIRLRRFHSRHTRGEPCSSD